MLRSHRGYCCLWRYSLRCYSLRSYCSWNCSWHRQSSASFWYLRDCLWRGCDGNGRRLGRCWRLRNYDYWARLRHTTHAVSHHRQNLLRRECGTLNRHISSRHRLNWCGLRSRYSHRLCDGSLIKIYRIFSSWILNWSCRRSWRFRGNWRWLSRCRRSARGSRLRWRCWSYGCSWRFRGDWLCWRLRSNWLRRCAWRNWCGANWRRLHCWRWRFAWCTCDRRLHLLITSHRASTVRRWD